MDNIREQIQEKIKKAGAQTTSERQKIYDSLFYSLKKEIKTKRYLEDDQFCQQRLEKIIHDIEAEYALLNKIGTKNIKADSTDSDSQTPSASPGEPMKLRDAPISQGEEQQAAPISEPQPTKAGKAKKSKKPKEAKPKTSAKIRVLSGKNAISNFIITSRQQRLQNQKRQEYCRFFKILSLIIGAFLLVLVIFLTFFTHKSHYSSPFKRKAVKFTNQDSQDFHKLSYRLTEKGEELEETLKNQDPAHQKDGLSFENLSKEGFVLHRIQHLTLSSSANQNNKTLTDFDDKILKTINIANNKASWQMLRNYEKNAEPPKYKIIGNFFLNDVKNILRLQLYQNNNSDVKAPYLLELSFIGQENHKALSFKRILSFNLKKHISKMGSELETGQINKISDDYFILALKEQKPFIINDLQALRNAAYIEISLLDQDNNQHDILIAKGTSGQKIFAEVIDSWLFWQEKNAY